MRGSWEEEEKARDIFVVFSMRDILIVTTITGGTDKINGDSMYAVIPGNRIREPPSTVLPSHVSSYT